MSAPAKRVLLAKPRGYCAGVDRAVEAVELALEQHGAPVYV
ncbi:MAG: 4-hydroxy-3-methylbut-2-enyl diphosphate reductase, partial [Pseudonocardiales bacterium]|nr:4-hydroxy-3-methylbut-2-enyl diphosphate reductase [Pseudonocardiales bacterium]